MSLQDVGSTLTPRGDVVHHPVKQVGGVIRQPRRRDWRKYPDPQQRNQSQVEGQNMKRRICVQEGVRCLTALVISRAVEQALRFESTPYMLRSRQCLIKYLRSNCPRISRPWHMVISDAEEDPSSSDLVCISILFYPDRYSRGRKSRFEVSGTLSFNDIVASVFASRRLRRLAS
ncbi:MAG: hypothetical protein G01um101477_355 [Candidatus Doudnabacteria bacterium Gr01-1014_77]|uniref:Uncharacterized protein n=1 Tax=Candidatus Doudnabacteria bacterium Gr01-1014_77 TaxID=2017133 RepID=A0A554JBS6_9BACT|nr:MAG: hypothetical protein G01um101477_355 [Candidatus Doudnabacteria bacterium Gr01-1014_77]